jgi:hypothetical protein
MVADVLVTLEEVTALITGAGAGVERVKFAELAGPAEFADMT